MAFKIDKAKFDPAIIVRRALSVIPLGWLRSPLGRGAAIAVGVAIVLAGWLLVKSGDTLQGLEAQTPPVQAAFLFAPPAAPAAPPAPAKPVEPTIQGALPGLIEQTQAGALPRIGPDGTMPWRAYAKQTAAAVAGKPRIAILVIGLGLQSATDERAIRGLPPEMSLAFLAYADRAASLMADAKAAGHEILINAPMEPDNYPTDDPGPRALLVKASADENVSRLDWDLARAVGYVGIAPSLGGRFTASPEPLQPVLNELARRGLLYVDTGTAVFSAAPTLARTIGVPLAVSDRTIDKVPTKAAIDHELAELEATARLKGSVLGIATPYPVTLERLAAWATTLEAKGIALVPVSAVTQAPAATPAAAEAKPPARAAE